MQGPRGRHPLINKPRTTLLEIVRALDPERKTKPEIVYRFGPNRVFHGKRNPYA